LRFVVTGLLNTSVCSGATVEPSTSLSNSTPGLCTSALLAVGKSPSWFVTSYVVGSESTPLLLGELPFPKFKDVFDLKNFALDIEERFRFSNGETATTLSELFPTLSESFTTFSDFSPTLSNSVPTSLTTTSEDAPTPSHGDAITLSYFLEGLVLRLEFFVKSVFVGLTNGLLTGTSGIAISNI
jgi:hypothetical protein